MWRFKFWYALFFSLVLLSCNDDSDKITPVVHDHLVSSTTGAKFSTQTFQIYSALLGLNALTDLIEFDVQSYRIVYKTMYKGNPIEASGIIFVPQNLTGPAPLLSLHHGTTFVNNEAPSVTKDFTGLEFFSSVGYITMVPDFLGYGTSSSIFHPYYDEGYSSSAVTDMILASKEFLSDENIPFNEKLFLAGYSEGGYVTLAAAKSIELNPIPGSTITAVAAGAGGYDLKDLLHEILQQGEYVSPSYLAFLVMAYNETNDWNLPLTAFFREPYADELSTYLYGDYNADFINAKLTNDLESLFTENFYQELTDPEGDSDFRDALEKNSVHGWNTSLPIKLYHGEADEVVPYQNSEITIQEFEDQGSENVSLTLFPLSNHVQSLTPTLVDVIFWFDTLK
ncbi:MAG TPA: prolyl oligopeptidase family serine peptidase [Cyclobacteriaceae bacterium]|nr:prolyl oligopeptidase family serine peptidase [Cyclobacteriaceae bacterium]